MSGGPSCARIEWSSYSTKLCDVCMHLASSAAEEWERRFYRTLNREEEALKLTLTDTLNYLRSNLGLLDLPKSE